MSSENDQQSSLVTCKACGGNGGAASDPCHACGGSGKQRITYSIKQELVTCASCGGYGGPYYNPCRVCGGKGVVPV